MNDTPAPAEQATEAAEAAPVTPSPAENLATLTSDAGFQADWSGSNGRPAQIAAVARKSELTKAAHGGGDAAAPVLPERIQEGLDADDGVSRAAAAAMIPGDSPDDYTFQWADAEKTDIETMQEQTTLAAQAAYDIGASPEYARTTVRGLEDMIAKSSGIPPSEEQLTEALTRQFGANADATVEAARASLAKMSPEAREWAINAAGALDASGAAWFTGRLASVHRANSG